MTILYNKIGGTYEGLNQTEENLAGQLIIKIFPMALNALPTITNPNHWLTNSLNVTPIILSTQLIETSINDDKYSQFESLVVEDVIGEQRNKRVDKEELQCTEWNQLRADAIVLSDLVVDGGEGYADHRVA